MRYEPVVASVTWTKCPALQSMKLICISTGKYQNLEYETGSWIIHENTKYFRAPFPVVNSVQAGRPNGATAMPYKTIIVNLEPTDAAESVRKAAIQLAEQHNAHLLGILIVQPVTDYVSMYGGLGAPVVIDKLVSERREDRVAQLKSLFKAETTSQSFVSEWRYISDRFANPDRTLLGIGGCADLLIVGGIPQQDKDTSNVNQERLVTIISGSACPVLVIPSSYHSGSMGERVLLAYDGSRESSRAILDALPVLLMAKDVRLHSVESPGIDTLHLDDNVRDIADALSRHGVKVEVSSSKAHGRDTGDHLLSVAADHGADCLVMGAPTHSRLREVFLGSAARHALNESKLPVFFSA